MGCPFRLMGGGWVVAVCLVGGWVVCRARRSDSDSYGLVTGYGAPVGGQVVNAFRSRETWLVVTPWTPLRTSRWADRTSSTV